MARRRAGSNQPRWFTAPIRRNKILSPAIAIAYAKVRTTGITMIVCKMNPRPLSHSSTPSHQPSRPITLSLYTPPV